jgi:hypothetical protein
MPDLTQIFVGATNSDYSAVSGTSGPRFEVTDSTAEDVPPLTSPTPTAIPDGLREWITSDDARQYEGLWVLLDDELAVVDSDRSPSALLRRHSEVPGPRVVYVQPRNDLLVV